MASVRVSRSYRVYNARAVLAVYTVPALVRPASKRASERAERSIDRSIHPRGICLLAKNCQTRAERFSSYPPRLSHRSRERPPRETASVTAPGFARWSMSNFKAGPPAAAGSPGISRRLSSRRGTSFPSFLFHPAALSLSLTPSTMKSRVPTFLSVASPFSLSRCSFTQRYCKSRKVDSHGV